MSNKTPRDRSFLTRNKNQPYDKSKAKTGNQPDPLRKFYPDKQSNPNEADREGRHPSSSITQNTQSTSSTLSEYSKKRKELLKSNIVEQAANTRKDVNILKFLNKEAKTERDALRTKLYFLRKYGRALEVYCVPKKEKYAELMFPDAIIRQVARNRNLSYPAALQLLQSIPPEEINDFIDNELQSLEPVEPTNELIDELLVEIKDDENTLEPLICELEGDCSDAVPQTNYLKEVADKFPDLLAKYEAPPPPPAGETPAPLPADIPTTLPQPPADDTHAKEIAPEPMEVDEDKEPSKPTTDLSVKDRKASVKTNKTER